ncbi:hypothetical protein [Martelella soudanensis]|uniref:hypothetical protein n=1 Tax=unclassified Martelella TaxID=2629616 RepID=UPI0015DE9EAE|nr:MULTISPECIES: hypothetical protein [unclassified Martelella]
MDNLPHKMAMDAIGFAAQILTPQTDHLVALVEAERSMHSYMHITDPTMYMRAIHSDGLRQQVELAKAALVFIDAVQKVKGELAAAEETSNV